jgi:hypothetical protein
MLDVPLGDLHKIGDQVIPALQLYINLGKSILEPVPKCHKFVVYANNNEKNNNKNSHYNQPYHGNLLF